MAGPKLNKEQRTLLKEYAWEKRTHQGWSHAKIANNFETDHGIKVDRSTVSRAISRVNANATETIKRDAVQAIFEAAARLDRVSELAFQQFINGKQHEDIGPSPEWLRVIIQAEGAKLKALGADVQKIELTGKDGGPVAMDDARSKLARLLAQHAAASGAGRVDQQPIG